MSLSEKAKTRFQLCGERCRPNYYDGNPDGECEVCNKEKWVRLEVHQKEIDRIEKSHEEELLFNAESHANDIREIGQKIEKLEREHGAQKKKLENFDIVDFLERHQIKYDEWLKHQFFELIEELLKE